MKLTGEPARRLCARSRPTGEPTTTV